MSRCFPFPPPGYERKARNDDGDLLEKEKQREKKHKKEKRDKEKGEGKEKREKDRSDGKHREKKDKREKHKDRDKKKDKEKDRDKSKDKSKSSDEKRLSGQPDSHVGEKLTQKEGKQKDTSADKKFSGQIEGHKAEKLSQNSSLDDESKYVKEFGRRIKDQATGTANQLEKFSGTDRKKDEGMLRLVGKSTSNLAADKEKDKRTEVRTTDGQSTRDGTNVGGNAMVQNTTTTAQTKFEVLPKLLDNNVDRRMEGNENTKDRESNDKRAVKSKEKDKEKKSHGKDKDRDKEKKKEDREKRREEKQKKKEEKEKKKEERAKEKIQPKITEPDKLRASNKHDIVDNHAIKGPQLPKDSNNNAPNDVNLKKRKDVETNGVLHAHDILPGKVARTTPSSSSHPSTQNGRILEPCQASVRASEIKEASNNLKMDNKELKINGIIEAQPLSVSRVKPKSATAVADPVAESSSRPPHPDYSVSRPPHPDSKYLSQVYSVPKMEWSDYDDQEWLFSSNASQPKKPKVESSAVEETPLVWAEARQIGSADICALPYVIPY
ncbi:myb-like protein X [Morus notabilis]|nr:myb-like protein X [Morus notabilis]